MAYPRLKFFLKQTSSGLEHRLTKWIRPGLFCLRIHDYLVWTCHEVVTGSYLFSSSPPCAALLSHIRKLKWWSQVGICTMALWGTWDQKQKQREYGENGTARGFIIYTRHDIQGCIQKFPDWPPLERELQMIQLPATMYSCIAVLWVSLVSFAAITLCVASQQVFIVVYFVIDSVWKLLGTPS
jgi:hypothetical protein